MADRMAIRTVRHADGKPAYSYRVVDYAPRAEDFAWCERELGNVEIRSSPAETLERAE